MAWHRSGDKPLSVPMMVSLPTHICVTRSQWVKCHFSQDQWILITLIYWWSKLCWGSLYVCEITNSQVKENSVVKTSVGILSPQSILWSLKEACINWIIEPNYASVRTSSWGIPWGPHSLNFIVSQGNSFSVVQNVKVQLTQIVCRDCYPRYP